jgi:hypothetical protein
VTGRNYARGDEYPNEGFLQAAIETYFKGYERIAGGDADLACRDCETGEVWIVEVKGLTSAVGLDFRTGLGQLLQRMNDAEAHYAMAVPNLRSFISQCRRVPEWVRRALRMHWLVVDRDGAVTVYSPDAPIDSPGSQ